jgi:SAM-dependent methyltransferase
MNRAFLRRHLVPVARRLPAFLQRPLRRLWRAMNATPIKILPPRQNRHDEPQAKSPSENASTRPGTAAQTEFGDDAAYQARIDAETAIFNEQVNVHDLPEIFHYWSNAYLRPKLETFGFSNPDQFFAEFLQRAYADAETRPVRFVSIGAGNCDTEVRIARLLIERGIVDFTLECLELNPTMLERGRALALEHGVAAQVLPQQGDFNRWKPTRAYAAVIANQSLHHVSNLEGLFDAVGRSLSSRGRFITSDMIGRNGHQRWPEALAIVQEFWSELPEARRYNLQLQRQERKFLDWDCAQAGFEGIRAQDILPLLIERFDFEFFLGYANVIDPFVDRSFGHHFDANSAADRAFIDRIHARDEAEILAGRIKPTHVFAVLRKNYQGETAHWAHLTPDFCVRPPSYVPVLAASARAPEP